MERRRPNFQFEFPESQENFERKSRKEKKKDDESDEDDAPSFFDVLRSIFKKDDQEKAKKTRTKQVRDIDQLHKDLQRIRNQNNGEIDQQDFQPIERDTYEFMESDNNSTGFGRFSSILGNKVLNMIYGGENIPNRLDTGQSSSASKRREGARNHSENEALTTNSELKESTRSEDLEQQDAPARLRYEAAEENLESDGWDNSAPSYQPNQQRIAVEKDSNIEFSRKIDDYQQRRNNKALRRALKKTKQKAKQQEKDLAIQKRVVEKLQTVEKVTVNKPVLRPDISAANRKQVDKRPSVIYEKAANSSPDYIKSTAVNRKEQAPKASRSVAKQENSKERVIKVGANNRSIEVDTSRMQPETQSPITSEAAENNPEYSQFYNQNLLGGDREERIIEEKKKMLVQQHAKLNHKILDKVTGKNKASSKNATINSTAFQLVAASSTVVIVLSVLILILLMK